MSGGESDACQNDSGGPLICVDHNDQPVSSGPVVYSPNQFENNEFDRSDPIVNVFKYRGLS